MKNKLMFIVILLIIILTIIVSIKNKTKNKNETKNNFIDYSFYKEENLERYKNYQNKNNTTDKITIIYVNIGLDKPFYTNTKPSPNQNNNFILVNKYHYLNNDFVPSNLIRLNEYAKEGIYLKEEAYQAFKKMALDIQKYNLNIRIISAYRSFDYQKNLYNNYLKEDNVSNVDKYSARPGFSEHQTGLAIDIDNLKLSYTSFDKTNEYKWMLNNAYKYGFILRYPKDKEHITGYMYEPWHYRYVGNIAKYIYNNNLTYEEYYYEFIDQNK